MITDAVAATMPAAGWPATRLYGDNGAFRAGVAKLGLGYVLAVSCDHRCQPARRQETPARRSHRRRPCQRSCWHRISAGTGSKGPRWYDWAWVSAHQPGHSLLIRRGSDRHPGLLPLLVTHPGPAGHPGPRRRACAGALRNSSRPPRARPGWTTTRCAPGPAGTATSPWPCSPSPSSWPAPPPRHPAPPADPWHHARTRRPIALTAAEIRRLFNGLVITPLRARLATPPRAISDIQHWSNWRRHHQGQARRSHYQRRLATDLGP